MGEGEISVAVITTRRQTEYRDLLSCFPSIQDWLPASAASTSIRGSLTASRLVLPGFERPCSAFGRCLRICRCNHGEGICIALQQAEALAEAIQGGDLERYEKRHVAIMRRPRAMAALLTALGNRHGARKKILSALSRDPELFEKVLSFHVGATDLRGLGFATPLRLGATLMRVRPGPADQFGRRDSV